MEWFPTYLAYCDCEFINFVMAKNLNILSLFEFSITYRNDDRLVC